jgi:two-component system response regulator TctD
LRLLLVEDNAALAELVALGLTRSGFAVDAISLASEVDDRLRSSQYAAVVLDLGLPDGDGLDCLRVMRARGDRTPVIILTARGSVHDRVDGLNAGADDYLSKPFATEELVARLQALLRRPGELLGNRLEVGDLALDVAGRQVWVAGAPQQLSAREIELLELLMRRAGRVIPKSYVEDQLFGLEQPIGSNAVEVSIHRLRRRLQDLDAGVTVHTVRGVGYLIALSPPDR